LQNKRKKVASLPCTVYENPDGFLATVEKLATQKEEVPPQTFITQCPASGSITNHMTPFYCERSQEGHLRLVWTDSLGGFGGLSDKLEQLVKKLKEKNVVLEIAIFTALRQRDEHNCAVFCIHDVMQLSKNQHTISRLFSELVRKSDSAMKFFEILPVDFMLPTQSLSQIEKYMEPYKKSPLFEERQLSKFERRLKKYEVESDEKEENPYELTTTKKINSYAERRGNVFEGIIWKKLLSEQNA
jgi:hypothetical protein